MVLIASCKSKPKEEYVEQPVTTLYDDAAKLIDGKNYEGAAKAFDEVERQHPYSEWATKAQLMSAYSWYQARKYDDAIIALDRYIQLHPGNKDVSYAYYLKALCYYDQISDVKRDQKITQQSFDALDEVIKRFPDSEYSKDAKLKRDLAFDHLAGKEMDIGRYYLRQGQYIAAINRFQKVITDYQTTTHVPEALYRMAEAYTSLGLVEEAKNAAAVLGYNFPGSEWYQISYWLVEMGQSRGTGGKSKWFGWSF